ncbi:fasciclin domain-containing protein [Ekhidna sp.]
MKKLKYIVAVALLVVLSACGDDKSSPSAIQYAGNAEGLFTEGRISDVDLFYAALVKTGLDSRLSDESTERTYLALDNSAMQAALQNGGFLTVEAADVDFLTTLIDNHTFSGMMTEDQLTKQNLTTEGGELVYVSEGGFFNAQGAISVGTNWSTNGIVHVLSFPILDFPQDNIATIVANAAADATTPEFTILNAALQATGLDATLSGTTEFTVFAPTDAAFAAAGFADFATLDAATTDEELTEILQNHVVAGRFLTLDLADSRVYTANGGAGTARGFDLDVEPGTASVEIPGGSTSDSETVNSLATNGTIHIVDNVLFPEAYVYEALGNTVAVDDPNGVQGFFGAFFTAMDASTFDYATLLSGDADGETAYSVIAPFGYAGGSTQAELDQYIFEGDVDFSGSTGTRVTAIGGGSYFIASTEAIDSDAISVYGETGNVTIAATCGGDACIQDAETYAGSVTMLGGTGLIPLPEMDIVSVYDADVAATPANDTLSLFMASLTFLELDSLDGVTYLAVQDSDLEADFRTALTNGGTVDESTIAAGDFADLIANIDAVDVATLQAVIDRHIITSLLFGLDLEEGLELSTRDGGTLRLVTVTADDGTNVTSQFGFLTDDGDDVAAISPANADVTAINGVLHTLTTPLPEQ